MNKLLNYLFMILVMFLFQVVGCGIMYVILPLKHMSGAEYFKMLVVVSAIISPIVALMETGPYGFGFIKPRNKK